MESIFAEYDVRLLKEYDLFAKQGNDKTSISQRLSYYGASGLEFDITQMELLTDQAGQEFYRQAVEAMGGDVSRTKISVDTTYEHQWKEATEEYEELLETEGMEDPLQIEDTSYSFLLGRVLPKEQTLSSRRVEHSSLASKRELQTGVGTAATIQTSIGETWLFASYLTEHFLNYTNQQNIHPLSYEAEYLLAGKVSDEENLEWVAKRLLAIRLGMNYAGILADSKRMSEAETISITVSALMLAPEAKEIVKQALLFWWAYEDSIVDLQSLYRGEKVPLLKTDTEDGVKVSYEDYLKTLLLIERRETLCMRALDLIELNLGIKTDTYVTALEVEGRGWTRRQMEYVCQAAFQYQ